MPTPEETCERHEPRTYLSLLVGYDFDNYSDYAFDIYIEGSS